MDEHEYKRICVQSDVMRRGDVRATVSRLERVRPDLAGELQALLRSAPVPKPASHEGGSETDFLWLDLAPDVIADIAEELGTLEADLVEDGAVSGRVSAAATLRARWNRAESSRPAV